MKRSERVVSNGSSRAARSPGGPTVEVAPLIGLEEVDRLGGLHRTWLALSRGNLASGSASQSADLFAQSAYDELLLEAAECDQSGADVLLEGGPGAIRAIWAEVGSGPAPDCEFPGGDAALASYAAARFDAVRNIVEVNAATVRRSEALRCHPAMSPEAASADPCFVHAREQIGAVLTGPFGRLLLHECIHASAGRDVRPFDVALDGPLTGYPAEDALVVTRPLVAAVFSRSGEGLAAITSNFRRLDELAEAATEALARKLWPQVASVLGAPFQRPPMDGVGVPEAYPAWRLLEVGATADDLRRLLALDAVAEDYLGVLGRVMPEDKVAALRSWLAGGDAGDGDAAQLEELGLAAALPWAGHVLAAEGRSAAERRRRSASNCGSRTPRGPSSCRCRCRSG